MRFVNFLLSFSLVCCLLTYSGCYFNPCGLNKEPKLIVDFQTPKDYTQVYGLKKVIQPVPQISLNSWAIPISIIKDITTVIFKSDSLSDTLTVHYNRQFKLESQRCGFRIFLDNFQIVAPTTFQQVYVRSDLFTDSYRHTTK